MAISRDGAVLVTAGEDKMARVWALDQDGEAEPEQQALLDGHADAVRCIALSPDGALAASGGADCTIRTWDVSRGGQPVATMRGHGGIVTAVLFADNARVISASEDMTIRLWDARTGAALARPFTGHTDAVHALALLPDGRLASGARDATIRIWSIESSEQVAAPIYSHQDAVLALAISPGGTLLASVSADRRVVLHSLSDPLPIPSADLDNEGMIGAATRDADGWVCGPRSEKMFWMPRARRVGLMAGGCEVLIGAQPTRIDMSGFVHEGRWRELRTVGRGSRDEEERES
jgi:WD40 repeat protein